MISPLITPRDAADTFVHTTVAATRATRRLSALWDGGRLQRRSSQILHAGELLPPVGEVAEGVGTGEVGGGGSQLQREDVVHHLAQTNVAGGAQGRRHGGTLTHGPMRR